MDDFKRLLDDLIVGVMTLDREQRRTLYALEGLGIQLAGSGLYVPWENAVLDALGVPSESDSYGRHSWCADYDAMLRHANDATFAEEARNWLAAVRAELSGANDAAAYRVTTPLHLLADEPDTSGQIALDLDG